MSFYFTCPYLYYFSGHCLARHFFISLFVFINFVFHSPQATAAKKVETLSGGIERRICPEERPIKGNLNYMSGERIYHLPDGSFYEKTNPEACFASKLEAEMAGFRASKR